MTEPERVTCPLCAASVLPSQILRTDTAAGEWEPFESGNEDWHHGPIYMRVVQETVTGCTVCGGGQPN